MRDRQWIFGSFYCRLNSFTSCFTVSCFPTKCHPKCLSWKRTQIFLFFSRAEQGWNCFSCLIMLLGEHLCVHAACHDTGEAQGNNDSVGATKVAQDSLGKKHKYKVWWFRSTFQHQTILKWRQLFSISSRYGRYFSGLDPHLEKTNNQDQSSHGILSFNVDLTNHDIFLCDTVGRSIVRYTLHADYRL